MSWAPRNVRTPEFREQYERLPETIRRVARASYRMFLRDPDHPSFQRKEVVGTHRGRHRDGTWCVRINMKFRALYVVEDGVNVWYWIGKHNDYENFIGKK